MKPQTFDISSEALDEFRDKMDAALATVVRDDLDNGVLFIIS